MIIVGEIVLIALLAAGGYVSACFYLNDVKWNIADLKLCKLNRTRMIYLILSAVIGIYLLYILHFVHQTEVINQVISICLICTLIPIAAVDFKVKKIPNQFLVAALAIRGILYIAEFMQDFSKALFGIKEDILGAAIMGVFFFLIFFIFKNSIGMGDVKLFTLMGLYQGLSGVINSIFFSLVASFFVAIVLLIGKKKKRTDTIPFGPCILLGTMMALRITGV